MHAAVSILAVIFAHFLIGSQKRVLLRHNFCTVWNVILVYNTLRMMSQMTLTKNMTNLVSIQLYGTYDTELRRFLYGLGFPFGVTLSSDESYDRD